MQDYHFQTLAPSHGRIEKDNRNRRVPSNPRYAKRFYSVRIFCAYRLGLPDAFCKNTDHFDLSTVPDLSRVVFRKWHRENGETISMVKPQLIICLYFGWLNTFRCVRTAKIAPRIASTAANNFAERTVLTRFTTRVILI